MISIETILDLHTITIHELSGCMQVVEERLDEILDASDGGHLNHAEKELEAHKRQPRGGGASDSDDDRGCGKGNTHGCKPGAPH